MAAQWFATLLYYTKYFIVWAEGPWIVASRAT